MVGLIVAVFQAVVPRTYLYVVARRVRADGDPTDDLYWTRYRKRGFDLENSRRWLKHASRWALASGVTSGDWARCSCFRMARSSTSTRSCSRW